MGLPEISASELRELRLSIIKEWMVDPEFCEGLKKLLEETEQK